jgi:nucleoside-diphosphate-sugar epimerase
VIGDSFHITSEEALSWDEIYRTIAAAAGAEARLVHVPSDVIAAHDQEWGDSLLGDKTHTAIFDNSKIRSVVPDFVCTVPFAVGAQEIIAWHDEDPTRRQFNEARNKIMDQLVHTFAPIGS